MKPVISTNLFTIIIVSLLHLSLATRAQDQTNSAPSASSPGTPATIDTVQASQGQPSRAVAEILRMLDAGVSKDVIRVYVENSPGTYALTPDDVIVLKQRGVPDDITAALLKKHSEKAEPGAAASAPQHAVPVPAPATAAPIYGGIDPDSYAYFQLYYLHPRALAAAYQRLGIYGPAPYGFYQPFSPWTSPGYLYPYGMARVPARPVAPGWR